MIEAGLSDAGYFHASNSFCAAEHGGTHLDAPIHFAEGRQTAAEVPLDQLIGPAVVVDVSAAAEARPEYLVGADDLEAWEAEYGRMPDGAIVLVRTGWGSRWPDRGRFLGTTLTGDAAVPELRFPGLHPEGAQMAGRESPDRCSRDRHGECWGRGTRTRGTAPFGPIWSATLGPYPPGAGGQEYPGVRECGGARQTATNRRLPGRAADEDRARERRPDPDSGRSFQAPVARSDWGPRRMNIPYTKHTLGNGLHVLVHEDHTCPIVAVNVWYHVGSKNERPGHTGFAHLFEHLMFEGSQHYDRATFTRCRQPARRSMGPRIPIERIIGGGADERARPGPVDGIGPHGLPASGVDPGEV